MKSIRKKSAFTITILSLLMASVMFNEARAQTAPERPMDEQGRQKLMELHKRSPNNYCTLYRVEIDNVFYIVNTCGGIVREKVND